MKKFLNLVLATGSLFSVAFQAQAVTFIDSFDYGTIDLEVNPNNLRSFGSVSDNSIFGGVRTVDLTLNTSRDMAFASTNLFVDSDQFSHSNNVGASSTAQITYDAGGIGLGVNLLDLGNSFAIDVVDIDLSNQFEVLLVDSSNRESSVTSSMISEPQQVVFDFASFSGVDFRAIEEINLVSHGGLNVDVEIDSFSIIGDREVNPLPNLPDNPASPVPESSTVFGLFVILGLSLMSQKKLRQVYK